MRTQLVDGLLADLLQGVRFFRAYDNVQVGSCDFGKINILISKKIIDNIDYIELCK